MSYPVLVFGKHGPGEVYVGAAPPPPVLRAPIFEPVSVDVREWGETPWTAPVRYRTLRLVKYACPLPEYAEWERWGEIREVPVLCCRGCGARTAEYDISSHVDCDAPFGWGVERRLFVSVYVEERA